MQERERLGRELCGCSLERHGVLVDPLCAMTACHDCEPPPLPVASPRHNAQLQQWADDALLSKESAPDKFLIIDDDDDPVSETPAWRESNMSARIDSVI